MKKFSAIFLTAALSMTMFSDCITPVRGADEILLHSTFETDEDGWSGRGAASAKATTLKAYEGNGSLSVTGRSASWNGAVMHLSSSVYKPGASYGFSAQVMCSEGSSDENIQMSLQYTDSSGTIIYDHIASVPAEAGKWIELSNDKYNIPSGASELQLYFEISDNKSDFWIDEVTVTGDGEDGTRQTSSQPEQKTVTGKISSGDINKDGIINIADLCLMKSAALGEEKDKTIADRSDLDNDDTVGKPDIDLMTEYLFGLTDSLPEKPSKSVSYEKSYDFPSVNSLKSSSAVPDPFVFADGSVVESPDDWGRRASEISCMYEYYMYGMWRDGSDEEVSYTISGNKMTINIKRKSTGKTASFPAVINLPSKVRHDGGAPVIVGMHTGISEKTATELGYAVITIDAGIFSNPVASDNTAHQGAFYTLYPYGNNWDEQTGALMGWSWGCSKILDALYAGAGKELNINPDSSIVTGVSRWGKATIVCGAFDKRFKMCAPSCSGAGGVALYRYMSEGKKYDFSSKGASSSYTYGQNEPLGSLQSTDERGWFNNRFLEFKNANQLPMDQHMLCSLVADPDRYLFIIGSCVSEDWVNAPSMWASYLGTKKIYEYLGIEDNIAINIHKEGHAVIEEDVKYMVAYFDKHVYGIEPAMDLKNLQTSVFDLPKNTDTFFTSYYSGWVH